MDVKIAETSYVGLHRFCKISKQIPKIRKNNISHQKGANRHEIFHSNHEFYTYRIELTSIGIDIWMKHFADKSDSWGFIWVLFRKT